MSAVPCTVLGTSDPPKEDQARGFRAASLVFICTSVLPRFSIEYSPVEFMLFKSGLLTSQYSRNSKVSILGTQAKRSVKVKRSLTAYV